MFDATAQVQQVIPSKHSNGGKAGGLCDGLFPPGLMQELESHPFLDSCRSNTISHDVLRCFLIQHQHYASHFTRFLCAVMANLPSGGDVRALGRNLVEETGLDGSGKPTHAELCARSLELLGVVPRSLPVLPATQHLIDAMYGYCRSTDPMDGLAALCLGAEAIVPVIYGAIVDAYRARGASAEALHYFILHVEEDEGHALTMRGIIDRLLADRPWRLGKVRAVAEDMVRLRLDMFDAVLLREAA